MGDGAMGGNMGSTSTTNSDAGMRTVGVRLRVEVQCVHHSLFSEAPVLAWSRNLVEIPQVGGSDNSSGGRRLLGVRLRGVAVSVLELTRYAAGDIHLRSCRSRRGAPIVQLSDRCDRRA